MHFSNAVCMLNQTQYMPTDLYNTISLFDFYNVLGQSDCNVIRNISNFILSMLKKRNSLTIL